MPLNKQLSQMLENDEQIHQLIQITAVTKASDPNHLQRRQQQRAISNNMIKLAIIYGQRQFSHGALTFTLTDRNLRTTPYYRFIDALRGLRVVCIEGLPNPQILTAYWHEKTRHRFHK